MSGWKLLERRMDRSAAYQRFQGQRLTWLKDTATSLKGGADLTRVVAESAQRCEDPIQRMVYADIRDKLSEGKKLTMVVGAWFSPQERMLLEALLDGARTNEELGLAMERVVAVVKPQIQVDQERKKLAVIILLVLGSTLSMLLFTASVIGFSQRFLPAEKWPPSLLMAFGFMNAITDVWWIFVVLGVIAPFAAAQVLQRWRGPLRKKFDKKVPGFVVYRMANASMAMIAIGAFAGAGRGLGETCNLLSRNATPWLRWYLAAIQERAKDRKEADIVDVGLFDWRLMVRVACLCMGSSLSSALCSVGLEASEDVAAELVVRLQRAQAALMRVIPGLMVLSVLAMGVVYATMVVELQRL